MGSGRCGSLGDGGSAAAADSREDASAIYSGKSEVASSSIHTSRGGSMIRSCAIPRAVGQSITIAFAIITLGCPGPVLYPEPEWSTPLPPGVSSNPDQFRSDVSKLRPADSVHVRARAGACLFCTVHVRIQALGETWRINPDSAPLMGIPVARIQNLDSTQREAMYGFRPDTEAVYHFWVDRRPGSTRARLTVIQVPVRGGVVTAGYQTNLLLCHPRPYGRPVTSDADFSEYKYHGDCTARVSATPREIREATLFPSPPFASLGVRLAAIAGRGMLVSGGGWIDCNSGCCK